MGWDGMMGWSRFGIGMEQDWGGMGIRVGIRMGWNRIGMGWDGMRRECRNLGCFSPFPVSRDTPWDDPEPHPQLQHLPFVFPPPAPIPKELPQKTVGNHGNHPLPPESRLEKKQEKGRKRVTPSWNHPRGHLDSGKKKLKSLSGINSG